MASTSSSKKDASKAKSQLRGYFAKLPPRSRTRLNKLRATIKSAVPRGVDGYSYGIPSLKLDGQTVVWYAAWKEHLSLYPLNATDREMAKRAGYKTAKSTIQFPMAEPLPVSLVKRLVKSRIAEFRKQAKS